MKRNIIPITPFMIIIANIVLLLLAIFITSNQHRFSLSGVIKAWAVFGFFFILSIGLWIENWGIIYASIICCDGLIIIVIWPHYTLGSIFLIIMGIAVLTMLPILYKQYIITVKKSKKY